MKRLLAIAVLCACLAPAAAAQISAGPDELGISFAPEQLDYCGWAAAGSICQAYLVATNPTHGIAGWECSVRVEAPSDGFVLGWQLMGTGPIPLYPAPDFMVGLGVPLPATPLVVLARADLWVGSLQWWWFYVGPLPASLHPSLPGTACYAAAEDVGLLVPLTPLSGSPDQPVATIFGCDYSPAQSETWGAVKGMFR